LRGQSPRDNSFLGRTILITGAGGSIGSALSKAALHFEPRHLVLLDHSERSLNEIDFELSRSGGISYIPVLGDVCDPTLITALLKQYQPEIVYHAAAFKHVPLTENNPFSAVRNNALGTVNLARVCQAQGISNIVMVSTDKAVNPISVMGASKRIGELALLNFNGSKTRMSAVRLGNVLGSQGSVVPAFAAQIERGGPVTVTHPDVRRYFLTMEEAVQLILLASRLEDTGGIFVPQLRAPVRILDIAHKMISNTQCESADDVSVVFTGLRPGDKMSEEFLFQEEFTEPTRDPRLLQVRTQTSLTCGFNREIDRLAGSVEERDLSSMIETMCRIVPTYRPTELVNSSKKSLFA
jgi:FlaA1/EpsC-like NDP-sugar epimerase